MDKQVSPIRQQINRLQKLSATKQREKEIGSLEQDLTILENATISNKVIYEWYLVPYWLAEQLTLKNEARCIIWEPKNVRNKTIFLSNFTDGWQTLIHFYQQQYGREIIRFALSDPAVKYPHYLFEFKTPTAERLVQLLKDGSKWEFFERGELLPFEQIETYRKKVKSERLNNYIMLEYRLHCGINISQKDFWESDKPAIEFSTVFQPT